MNYLLILLCVAYCAHSVNSKLTCKNEDNKDVDWFIALKYPSSPNYFFLSSDKSNKKWIIPKFGLDSSNSMVGLTLKQTFDSKATKRFYGFYNDEPSDKMEKSTGGHLKGVVNFDTDTGFWLVHSVPKFPQTTQYDYPTPQMINGQSFFCVSISTKYLKPVLKQLLLMYAKVYSYNIPAGFSRDDDLNLLLDKFIHNAHTPGDKSSLLPLSTLAGVKLQHFGKSELFEKDLYDSFIAPSVKAGLFTETWPHGEKLDSNCSGQYKVMNVKELSLNNLKVDGYFDHSKWAVSSDSSRPFVCVGDINRVKSQYFRGGGSLCFQNSKVWKVFRSSVLKFEKCSDTLYYNGKLDTS